MELWEIAAAVVFGVGVGFFSALFGVGGGVFIVPFVVLVLGEGQHFAEGTSLLAIVPIAAVGVAAHTRKGYVAWKEAGFLALGGAVGALAGVLLAYQLSGASLRKVFGAFLLVMAARTIWSALRAKPGSDPASPAAD
jgi:uncharacterized membrane protein YfcA